MLKHNAEFSVGDLAYLTSYEEYTGLVEVISVNNKAFYVYVVQILNGGLSHGHEICCCASELEKLPSKNEL
jgi:hypothetical protein